MSGNRANSVTFHTRLLLIVFTVACASSRTPAVPTPAAFSVSLDRFGDSTLGMGCLPAGKDSTEFSLVIIVDSAEPARGSVAISLADRPAAQNARNPNVAATLYRPGNARVTGAGCNKSGGAVFRAAPTVLQGATIVLDPPNAVIVSVYAATGRLLVSRRVVRPPTRHAIEWTAPST